MNPASLSALAALSGSAVGGLTSFFSSWLGQSGQLRSQLFLNDKGRRQELYREFVDEASRSYVDSLTRDTPDLTRLVAPLRFDQSHEGPIVVEGDRRSRKSRTTDRAIIPGTQ
jgi:hypothetical protein